MVKIVFSRSRPTFPSKKSSVGELAQPCNSHRILTCAIAYYDRIFIDVFFAIVPKLQIEIFNIYSKVGPRVRKQGSRGSLRSLRKVLY